MKWCEQRELPLVQWKEPGCWRSCCLNLEKNDKTFFKKEFWPRIWDKIILYFSLNTLTIRIPEPFSFYLEHKFVSFAMPAVLNHTCASVIAYIKGCLCIFVLRQYYHSCYFYIGEPKHVWKEGTLHLNFPSLCKANSPPHLQTLVKPP